MNHKTITNNVLQLLTTHKVDANDLDDTELRMFLYNIGQFGFHTKYDTWEGFRHPEYHYITLRDGYVVKNSGRSSLTDITAEQVQRVMEGKDIKERTIMLKIVCSGAPNFDIYGISFHETPQYYKLDNKKKWFSIEPFSTMGMVEVDSSAFVSV